MNRNSDFRQSDWLFSPELAEAHVRRARQLRSEVIARGIRRLFAKMHGSSRRMSGAHCGTCA